MRIIDDVGVADWYQLRLEYLGRIDPTLDIKIFSNIFKWHAYTPSYTYFDSPRIVASR